MTKNRIQAIGCAVVDFIDQLTKVSTAVMFTIMLFIVLVGVFFRYVLVSPITWSEEVPRYIMVWMTFPAAAIALKRKQHIGMVIVVEKLPPPVRKAVGLLNNLLVLVFLIVATNQGFQLVLMVGSDQRTPLAEIPMSWLYCAVPVGCILMIIQLIRTSMEEFIEQVDVGQKSVTVSELSE